MADENEHKGYPMAREGISVVHTEAKNMLCMNDTGDGRVIFRIVSMPLDNSNGVVEVSKPFAVAALMQMVWMLSRPPSSAEMDVRIKEALMKIERDALIPR